MEKFPEKHFLEQYRTHEKPEAKQAAVKKEQRTGEKGINQDRSERIKAYIERLEKIFLNSDPEIRERNIELLKPKIYENSIIDSEDFPESHFDFQKQLLINRGFDRNDVEHHFDGEKRQQEIERVIESQKLSLDNWIDYLTGEDCRYPADIKYFAMQGVLKSGDFDTEKYAYSKRTKKTTTSFPEIDREALSVVLGAVEAQRNQQSLDNYSPELIQAIKAGQNFPELYSLTMKELDQKAGKSELLPITQGEWLVFEQGSDPQQLVNALAGKRSNLCIADIGSATSYLNQGSVEVYFSYNRAQKPTIPRIAIAHNQDRGVYEVRGTYNKNEDIDPYMEQTNILMQRLKELPNGESFAKKDADMRKMTEIYNKCFQIDKKTKETTYLNPDLTAEELRFLYEIDSSIEGFGYQKDPRIEEIRSKRNPTEDLPILFDCTREQIATNAQEINENTKVYNGELYPNIFKELPPTIEKIYTNFPEKISEVYIKEIEIPSEEKTAQQYEQELTEQGHKISDWAKDILPKGNLREGLGQKIKLFIVSNKFLGFPNGATRAESKRRAQELGIANETLPAIVGLELRKQYTDQPNSEYILIDMESVLVRGGRLYVFFVYRNRSVSWLDADGGRADSWWHGLHRWAFSQ